MVKYAKNQFITWGVCNLTLFIVTFIGFKITRINGISTEINFTEKTYVDIIFCTIGLLLIGIVKIVYDIKCNKILASLSTADKYELGIIGLYCASYMFYIVYCINNITSLVIKDNIFFIKLYYLIFGIIFIFGLLWNIKYFILFFKKSEWRYDNVK